MSATPRYQLIKDRILEQIRSGKLGPNDRVPSETELVQALGVSRMTANRALNELRRDGVLVRVVGVGTFVADRRAHGELLSLRDIADELAESGHSHSMDVLVQESVVATRDLAAAFELAPGARLVRARILHRRDAVPILLEERFVNAALVPQYADVDLSAATSYRYLTELAPLEQVEHSIRAVVAAGEVRELLQIGPDEAVLVVRRRTWSGGQIASIATLHYAGNRYELTGRFRP